MNLYARTRRHQYRRTLAVAVALIATAVLHGTASAERARAITPNGASTARLAGAASPAGLSCDNATAATIAACITQLLGDPRSPYARGHKLTATELRPAAAPRMTAAAATTATAGSWRVVADLRTPSGDKINSIHVSLTKLGKVLITAGSGYDSTAFANKLFRTFVWNPTTGELANVSDIPDDLFCAGHMHTADGTIIFFGGTGRYGVPGGEYYGGTRTIYKFDETNNRFVRLGAGTVGRWYPNAVANAAGNPIVVAGLDETSIATDVNEYYSPSTGKTTRLPGRRLFPMYPGMHLLASGSLFYNGANVFGRLSATPGIWKWSNNSFYPVPGLQHPQCRDQASSVLLYPAQAQRSMVIGGGCSPYKIVTNGTAIATLTGSSPRFVNGPTLPWPAMQTCALNLPDRSVFVAGGGNHNSTPTLRAAVLRYGAQSWTPVANPAVPRMYHSGCLLMPDGSVMTFGTNTGPNTEARVEQYRPWYMQAGVTRPVITAAPKAVRVGGTAVAYYRGPNKIADAHLTRLGSATHSTDPNARQVQVGVVQWSYPGGGGGKVGLRFDSRWGVLPLGPYLLTLVDTKGVPSTSTILTVLPPAPAGGSAPSSAAPASCGHCCGTGC